tara:strand:- start:1398 stop:2015 length:618 start_codon:yes stop_codon:yes gene_type:complete
MSFFNNPNFQPKRKFRWIVSFSKIGGSTAPGGNSLSFMATKCSKPSYNLDSTQHRVLNHEFKFPNIVKWQDVTISFIDAVNPDVGRNFYNSLLSSGYEPPSSQSDLLAGVTKAGAHAALGQVSIKQLDGGGRNLDLILNPGETPPGLGPTKYIEEWILHNAFITSAKFGDLDYNTDDLVSIDLTIKYDYAKLTSFDPGAAPSYQV